MRLHRFIGDFDFSASRLEIRDVAVVRQIRVVLRLKRGGSIVLSDGHLNEAETRIESVSPRAIEVFIERTFMNGCEPATAVILYCAMLKRENFEWVVEKATELGVREIVPVLTARTVKTGFRAERLEKIAREAAEQSGRGVVPAIRSPLAFERAMREAPANNVNLFCDIGRGAFPALKSAKRIGIFIGPEGGWTEEEAEAARAAHLAVVSLGKTTLRAETAAIVAVARAVAALTA